MTRIHASIILILILGSLGFDVQRSLYADHPFFPEPPGTEEVGKWEIIKIGNMIIMTTDTGEFAILSFGTHLEDGISLHSSPSVGFHSNEMD